MGAGTHVIERFLIAGQAAGAMALAATWWRAVDGGWPVPALVLLILGLAVAIASFLSLGSAFRVGPAPRPDSELVRHGVYRWFRHPMYLAVILVLAAALVSRPTLPVAIAVAFNLLWYLAKASFEEDLLLARFPDYAAYRRQTIGLPTVTRNRTPEEP